MHNLSAPNRSIQILQNFHLIRFCIIKYLNDIHHEVSHSQVDQKECHPVPVPPDEVAEGDGVGGEANHEHDAVDSDADDLGFTKFHVIWQTKV